MLSYQHAYHAANLADVHKHSLLAWMLAYMAAKPKPLTYIETHAGRGLYRLDAAEAVKTGEAAMGIAKVANWFTPDHPFARILAHVRTTHGATAYPGSPLVAALSLRADDPLHLAELHPQEYAALNSLMAPYPARCQQIDGAEMALALTPPTPRRGVLLLDPSYEVKTDYQTIPVLLRRVARKWPVGTLILWYPLLVGAPHREMLKMLTETLPDGVRHEVAFPPARPGHRMIGSGLFVVNPPYGFSTEALRLTKCFATLAAQA